MKLNTWVVYLVLRDEIPSGCAVCTESEWLDQFATRPEKYRLIQGGILSEMHAERIARTTKCIDDTIPLANQPRAARHQRRKLVSPSASN